MNTEPPGESTLAISARLFSVSGTCSSTCGVRITSRLPSGMSMFWMSSLTVALCADSS